MMGESIDEVLNVYFVGLHASRCTGLTDGLVCGNSSKRHLASVLQQCCELQSQDILEDWIVDSEADFEVCC